LCKHVNVKWLFDNLYRFPFLFPIDPPGVVAEKIVEGIRKELEYIYTPRLIGWLALLSWYRIFMQSFIK